MENQKKMVGHRVTLSHKSVPELRTLLENIPDDAKLSLTDDTAWCDEVCGEKYLAEWETLETDEEYAYRLKLEKERAARRKAHDLRELRRLAKKYGRRMA